jgi:hypothetical protein
MGSLRLSPFFAVNQRNGDGHAEPQGHLPTHPDTIVEQLETGAKPWIRPWRGSVRHSLIPRRATGEAYRGINVLMLWVSGQMFGYEENTWMTYRQAQDLGGQVRKGEKGTLVVKYGTFTPKGARRRRGSLDPLPQGTPSSISSRSRTCLAGFSARPRNCRVFRFRTWKPSRFSSETPAQGSATAA